MTCPPAATPRARSADRFVWIATALFALVVAIGLWRHELWRDEAKAWLIARDSTSLLNVLYNRRYEGHPVLWYAVLYVASRFTRSPIAMQVVHGLIATVGAFVFVRFAPFNRLIRALFIAGIYPLYQYAVVSRNYALELPLLFGLLALFAAQKRRHVLAAVGIALLASTSMYGFFLAGAFAAAWGTREITQPLAGRRVVRGVAIAIAVLGLVAAVLQLIPPPPATAPDRSRLAIFPASRFSGNGFAEATARIWDAVVPVPDPMRITNAFTRDSAEVPPGPAPSSTRGEDLRRWLRLSGALALLCGVGFAVWSSAPALVFLACATSAMVVFEALLFDGRLRHHGHYFLAIVAALWLWRATVHRPFALPLRVVLTILLAIHAAVGVGYVIADIRSPYSPSRQAARLLTERYGRNFCLIAEPGHYGSPVAAYLDVPVYFPTRRAWGTYELLDGTPKRATWPELQRAMTDVLATETRPVVLLSSVSIKGKTPGVELVQIAWQHVALIDEGWTLYELRRVPVATTAPTTQPTN